MDRYLLVNLVFLPSSLATFFCATQPAHVNSTNPPPDSSIQGQVGGIFSLQSGAPGKPVRAASEGSPIQLETPTGTIYGSLVLPAKQPSSPMALIISGSGPTDRNGNSTLLSGRNDSLEMIAKALRDAGIASVRYDKRGIGQSMAAITAESGLTFTTYIDDAVAWIRLLKIDPRFSGVAVIGHSEGSLIGMEAARRGNADAFVSLEGAGEPANLELKRQLQSQPPEIRKAAFAIIDSLTAGKEVTEVPKDLLTLFRPGVQPYMISWFRYDPRRSIAELTTPVLIVHGSTDLQVPVEDALMLHGALPSSELTIIEGMNHVLKRAPAESQRNFATYSNADLPLAPELVTTLRDFLRRTLN